MWLQQVLSEAMRTLQLRDKGQRWRSWRGLASLSGSLSDAMTACGRPEKAALAPGLTAGTSRHVPDTGMPLGSQ